MPSRDDEHPSRRSRKEDDSPRAKDKDKSRWDKKQSRQSHIERPKSRAQKDNPDTNLHARASMTDLPSRQEKATMTTVPEMSRRASVGEPKSGSYPAFSKEHSREAVRPSQEAAKSKTSIVTPDATEGPRSERSRYNRTPGHGASTRAPPSPPLTADEGDVRRTTSAQSGRRSEEGVRRDAGRKSVDSGTRSRTSHLRNENHASPRKASTGDDSDSSVRTVGSGRAAARKHTSRKPSQSETLNRAGPTSQGNTPTSKEQESSQAGFDSDSQATSIAPERPSTQTPAQEAQGGTPKGAPQVPISKAAASGHGLGLPPHVGGVPFRSFSQPQPSTSTSAQPFSAKYDSRPGSTAPPPPPPMELPDETPRVDYLLLNGGLTQVIPKTLLPVTNQTAAPTYSSPRIVRPFSDDGAARVFQPITSRLEDLNKVLSKNGSVAVATGYRSVARRLLDRLENVFARNISSEKCHCAVCNSKPGPELSLEEQDGISWGEILEFVSGRRELPQWPPFTLDAETRGLGISERVDAPMQKLDPDVPDEFRQHYMRQNDKTKRSVQTWLEAQTFSAAQTEPPQDVDDETLSFAMLTRLDAEKRPHFTALMKGHAALTNGRSPSPSVVNGESENTVLDKTSLALQRLYRLSSRPRRPESTIYLINNPHLHGMLATLAAISPTEWDILVSGRFDGFLWSGAEGIDDLARAPPSRGPTPLSRTANSRGPTPFSPAGGRTNVASPVYGMSRGATPFSSAGSTAGGGTGGGGGGGPVQHDEETEVAVLGELERAIYRDMEQLEDAFEAVHQQAEAMRGRLRARAAGLLMAAQARRSTSGGGTAISEMDARLGTPASAAGGGWSSFSTGGIPDDDATVFDDGRSELAPDDSASNISFAARRRRGKERRTPGLEDDVGGAGGGTAADRRRRR